MGVAAGAASESQVDHDAGGRLAVRGEVEAGAAVEPIAAGAPVPPIADLPAPPPYPPPQPAPSVWSPVLKRP
mgnify:CR=1 FL=1